jgi:aminoglycoside 6'-N-acetyltransferase I
MGAAGGDASRSMTERPSVRAWRDADWSEWRRMSHELFPDQSADDDEGMREFLVRPDAAVFVLERAEGGLAGFVEVGSRPYADGCNTSPVGYIEAWYVDPDARRAGHGRALLAAAEEWARARGYREMASDALLDNEVSHRAHERSGYVEVERAVKYRKAL